MRIQVRGLVGAGAGGAMEVATMSAQAAPYQSRKDS